MRIRRDRSSRRWWRLVSWRRSGKRGLRRQRQGRRRRSPSWYVSFPFYPIKWYTNASVNRTTSKIRSVTRSARVTTKTTRNPSLQQKRKRGRGRALLLLEGCKIQKLCFVLCFLSISKTMYLDGFGFWRSGLCLYILNGAVHHESSKTEQTKARSS